MVEQSLEDEGVRRPQNEQDQWAQPEELMDFIEHVNVPLHWVGKDGTILWANRAELAFLGYSREEYVGHSITDFHVDQAVIEDILACLGRDETLRDYQARLRTKDGMVKHVLISSSVYWREGEFIHTRCVTRDITPRREAEMAAQRLAAVVESSNDPIYSKDLNGIITSWNAAAENMYGYTAEEAIGQSIAMVVPEEHQVDLYQILERLRLGESIDHFETMRIAKNGRRIDTSLTLSPVRSPTGEISGISSIARDITEQKQMMRAVENSERRLRALFDHAHDLILLTDDTGRYIDVNPAVSQVLGYAREELLTMSVVNLTPGTNWEQGEQLWQEFLRQGRQQGEYRLQSKDGQQVYTEYRAVANIVPGVHLSILHDVTERRRAEQQLADAFAHTNELYRITRQIGVANTAQAILAALTDSVYFKNSIALGFFWFNRPWVDDEPEYGDILAQWSSNPEQPDLTGLRCEFQQYDLKALSAPDHQVFVEDTDETKFASALEEVLHGIGSRSFITIPLIAQGVCRGYLYSHWAEPQAYMDDDRRHMQQLADQAAVTLYNLLLYQSEAEARQAAEQAGELKMRFLAMISHELRTPLTSIKGFATTLLAPGVQFEEQEKQQFIEIISEESNKLQNLIEQLLDLTRIQAGSFAVQPAPVTLDQIVESSMAQLQSLCADHDLQLEIAEGMPQVNADNVRIGQVLTNLVHNACKFSPPHSRIHISAVQQERFIQVDVSDEGTGIPVTGRESIFEPFRQLEGRKLERGTSGVGLGLAIARGIVEAHGGRIWVQDREGQGATLSFTLPTAFDRGQEHLGG